MGQPVVEKQRGTTPAERYLARLCERTFLSLWSYPSVSRDVFVPGTKTGKEVCDLLVLFEDRILIFSDKDCAMARTENIELDWSRWFRKAIVENARQAHGAERWICKYPSRLFLDRACTIPLPISPSIHARTKFHLIVVAHAVSGRCREMLGGSGSLMLRSDLKGKDAHVHPFAVGDLNPAKSFVHVLDDTTLDILMLELDTVSDFVSYLDKKEELIRKGPTLLAAGEEELLSNYLRNTDDLHRHCFRQAFRLHCAD